MNFCSTCGAQSVFPVLTCPRCNARGITLANLDDIRREEDRREDAAKPQTKQETPRVTRMENALNVFLLDKRIRAFLDANDPKSVEQAQDALKTEVDIKDRDYIYLSQMDCYAGKWRAQAITMGFYDQKDIERGPGVYCQMIEGCGYNVYEMTADEAEKFAEILIQTAKKAREEHAKVLREGLET